MFDTIISKILFEILFGKQMNFIIIFPNYNSINLQRKMIYFFYISFETIFGKYNL